MGMRCSISSEALAAIRAHAAAAHPLEACGLLLGQGDRVTIAEPAANVADRPEVAFEIDPGVLIAAHRAARAGGPLVLGCYHSHPRGDAMPSIVDAAAAAADGQLWIIVAGDAVRGWRAVADGALHGRFDAVELLAR